MTQPDKHVTTRAHSIPVRPARCYVHTGRMMRGNAFCGSNVLLLVVRFPKRSRRLLVDEKGSNSCNQWRRSRRPGGQQWHPSIGHRGGPEIHQHLLRSVSAKQHAVPPDGRRKGAREEGRDRRRCDGRGVRLDCAGLEIYAMFFAGLEFVWFAARRRAAREAAVSLDLRMMQR